MTGAHACVCSNKIDVCVCVCVYMRVYICVCICVYMMCSLYFFLVMFCSFLCVNEVLYGHFNLTTCIISLLAL